MHSEDIHIWCADMRSFSAQKAETTLRHEKQQYNLSNAP